MLDVIVEDTVEGCGFTEGSRLGTGEGKMEAEGDIGGEWSDDLLVGIMKFYVKIFEYKFKCEHIRQQTFPQSAVQVRPTRREGVEEEGAPP